MSLTVWSRSAKSGRNFAPNAGVKSTAFIVASLKRQLLLLLPSRVELLLHSDERLAVPALKKLAYAASSSMSCIIMRTLMDRSDRPSALLAVGEDGTVWPLRSPLRKDKRRKSLVLGSTHELEAWSMCSRRPHTQGAERERGGTAVSILSGPTFLTNQPKTYSTDSSVRSDANEPLRSRCGLQTLA